MLSAEAISAGVVIAVFAVGVPPPRTVTTARSTCGISAYHSIAVTERFVAIVWADSGMAQFTRDPATGDADAQLTGYLHSHGSPARQRRSADLLLDYR
jgi:hypothetical protein